MKNLRCCFTITLLSLLLLAGCTLDSVVDPDDNLVPVADAGADLIVTDANDDGTEPVGLDGSASSDPDGSIVSLVWSAKGQVIAMGPAPTVVLPVGQHSVTLVVTDNRGAFAEDDVVITVEPNTNAGNAPPVADAGADQTVVDLDASGRERVTLDPSGSHDPDGRIVDYAWTVETGRIRVDHQNRASFPLGRHVVTLTVTDNGGSKDTDTVIIEVVSASNENLPPVADAGPDRTVSDADGNGSELVSLDGSGSSDPDGMVTSWVWHEGASQLATGRTPSVTLAVGVHTITLTVADDAGDTDTDTVVITVAAAAGNEPPIANAGPDRTVVDNDASGSETISLDGSGSTDPDGTIASWVWREGASQLATGRTPSVTLAVGVHTITLTVTDDAGDTDTDTVVITVDAPVPSISYSSDIQPYFNVNCVDCHRNGGPGGVDLDSWQSVMNGGRNGPLVVPGDSSRGILLPKIRDGHRGAPHGTTIEQDLVTWIDAGAPNN